jgi:Fe-S cluster assembly protein SufD
MTTLTQPIATNKESIYVKRYRRRLEATHAEWLREIHTDGINKFVSSGYPTRRDEEWRFTPIGAIAETEFADPGYGGSGLLRSDLANVPFGDLGCTTLVFIDGKYSSALSTINPLEAGLVVGSLATALESTPDAVRRHLAQLSGPTATAFAALNAGLFEDGAYINIPEGMMVDETIHLLYISSEHGSPTSSFPRNLIIAGKGSHCTIVETYVGLAESVYLTCPVTEVFMEQNAGIDHYKLQQESINAFHLGAMNITLGRSSVFSSHGITLGGSISRNDISALMADEYAECTLNGLYLANGRRIVDNHTTIDHAMPNCPSHEVYKGILNDSARGVFNGKIFVREDAQKTDAKQTNKTLLLSDNAQIFTKPQLEIFADDVRCTHGATIGQLDPNQLFYLQARGIGKEEARNLLVYAFASDVINRIKVEPARQQLDKQLFTQLAKVQDYDSSEHEYYEDA